MFFYFLFFTIPIDHGSRILLWFSFCLWDFYEAAQRLTLFCFFLFLDSLTDWNLGYNDIYFLILFSFLLGCGGNGVR